MHNVEYYEQRIADLETQQLDRYFKDPQRGTTSLGTWLDQPLEEAVTSELMRCYRSLQLARLAKIRFGQ
jgi:hypothetical protein